MLAGRAQAFAAQNIASNRRLRVERASLTRALSSVTAVILSPPGNYQQPAGAAGAWHLPDHHAQRLR